MSNRVDALTGILNDEHFQAVNLCLTWNQSLKLATLKVKHGRYFRHF